ncbi:YdeI/OmpD-associated family protein [Echinicola sp. CAU 1574]|uniref:YdeI/OmpD-associated family protein n=1 Tax=Echinicola arenosa TaxID=2774144 RepID=A0ABR9AP64_9BACT|nr:YdeI/OmpD-associated family protein [Echinicola arenosa]MBD8489695.1 YdeI/OmpD-associated family protein [Echinicola arenosa]
MNTNVEDYFTDGCGRCPLGGTPDCKVHLWTQELKLLRQIVRECGLAEESKWGVPCYTHNQKNVAIISAFKNHCALSFFKGSLLKDEEGLLEKPGENTQAGRIIKFTNVQKIQELQATLKAYLFEAIEVEQAGLAVEYKETSAYDVPEEFQQKLDEDPGIKAAFEALTPGRQKGYLLHFSQAKQSKTREARIEKCLPMIFAGKGLHDR